LVTTAHRARPPLALTYHGIGVRSPDQDPLGLFVSERNFAAQVRRLRRWGYLLVTFGELASRARRGTSAGCAALTFDDGFAAWHTALMPLLNSLKAPATLFVVSGWFGGRHPDVLGEPLLTVPQLRDLSRAGLEIGVHTHSHPDLTTLPFDQATAELSACQEILEETLQQEVDVAAYPYGHAEPDTWKAAEAAGLVAACRTGGAGSWANPFDLPRHDMWKHSSITGLRLKRANRYEAWMTDWEARILGRASRYGWR
jgi:peptidoglycan/xylan/chitin deacetylase (PgdA/CDA1 family)